VVQGIKAPKDKDPKDIYDPVERSQEEQTSFI